MTLDKEFEAWLHEFDEAGLVRDCDIVILEWMQATWKAARAIDAKRIAELEAWANRPVTDNTQLIANMEAQITDLEAEIARLTAIIEGTKVVDNVFSK